MKLPVAPLIKRKTKTKYKKKHKFTKYFKIAAI